MLLGAGIMHSPRKGLVKQEGREGAWKLLFQSKGVAGEGNQNRTGCQVKYRAMERQSREYCCEQLVWSRLLMQRFSAALERRRLPRVLQV